MAEIPHTGEPTPMAPAHLRVRRGFWRTRCSCGLSWPCPDREWDERPIPDGDAVPARRAGETRPGKAAETPAARGGR
jgi:hypothetical protein